MIVKNIKEFNQAINNKNNKQPILGIDFGRKKTGIAISNFEYTISMPLQIILAKDYETQILMIKEVAKTHHAIGIVIGLPLKLDGTESEQTYKVKKFSEILSDKLKLPIFLYDERLTSKAADNFLKRIGIKRKERNSIDDMTAASIILEGALKLMQNFKNNNKC